MKKSNFFFALIAVLAMMMFSQANVIAEIPPCGQAPCPIDNIVLPPTNGGHSACFYDIPTNTHCCITVYYTLYHRTCPNPLDSYWDFEITSIEVWGNCLNNQSEIMKNALKVVMVAGMQYGPTPITSATIKIPDCIQKVSCNSYTETWEPCGIGTCCRLSYTVGWDTLISDFRLYSRTKSSSGWPYCDVIGTCGDCKRNCDETPTPETGPLDVVTTMPYACESACTPDIHIPPKWTLATNGNGDEVSGGYSVGFDGSTPCINIHYFWIQQGSLSPTDALELFVRKALREVWVLLGSGPSVIKVKLWSCMYQVVPGTSVYEGCNLEQDCCEITFDINQAGDEAIVTNHYGSTSCSSPCISPCDIFSSGTFPIPKLAVTSEQTELNSSLRIIPNPNNGEFRLEFNSIEKNNYDIKVVDINGNEIFIQNISASVGMNTLNIDLAKIPVGIYYLQLLNPNLQISSVKFIKH